MLKALAKFSYRLFGRLVFKYRDRFGQLAEDLRKARLPYALDEYLSLIILLSLLVFLAVFVASVLFLGGPTPKNVLVSLLLSLGATFLVVANLSQYPRFVALNRASDIDAVLPYALTHMATLAGSEIPPHHIFRIMGKIKRYGEVSRECEIIYRDVAVLGKDLFTALSDAAKASPSRLWTEVLWGISSTLRGGGSLRDYLYSKSRELQAVLERKEKEAVETMNLLTDIYLIIFVMGPILAAIMLILASMMTGGRIMGADPLTLFSLLVYLVMPVTGAIFLLAADTIRPREMT